MPTISIWEWVFLPHPRKMSEVSTGTWVVLIVVILLWGWLQSFPGIMPK